MWTLDYGWSSGLQLFGPRCSNGNANCILDHNTDFSSFAIQDLFPDAMPSLGSPDYAEYLLHIEERHWYEDMYHRLLDQLYIVDLTRHRQPQPWDAPEKELQSKAHHSGWDWAYGRAAEQTDPASRDLRHQEWSASRRPDSQCDVSLLENRQLQWVFKKFLSLRGCGPAITTIQQVWLCVWTAWRIQGPHNWRLLRYHGLHRLRR